MNDNAMARTARNDNATASKSPGGVWVFIIASFSLGLRTTRQARDHGDRALARSSRCNLDAMRSRGLTSKGQRNFLYPRVREVQDKPLRTHGTDAYDA